MPNMCHESSHLHVRPTIHDYQLFFPHIVGTVGLLFLYCWPPPYTVGLIPMLLVFSPTDFMEAGQGNDLKGLSFEQSIFKSHGSPSYSYTVALLHALLAFSPTVYYLKKASH